MSRSQPPAGGSTTAAGSVAAVDDDLATALAPASVPVDDRSIEGSAAPRGPVCPVDATAGPAPLRWSPADLRMRRLLRLPVDAPKASEASARSLVERSLLISMVRCLLTYIVLPFVAPAIGVGLGVAPVIGVTVGSVAIVANIASIRRFWRADHRYRWHYTALATVIILMLTWLIVADFVDLFS